MTEYHKKSPLKLWVKIREGPLSWLNVERVNTHLKHENEHVDFSIYNNIQYLPNSLNLS